MKFRLTAVYEYDVPDDTEERLEQYSTADPAEMLDIDRGQAFDILMLGANTFSGEGFTFAVERVPPADENARALLRIAWVHLWDRPADLTYICQDKLGIGSEEFKAAFERAGVMIGA